MLNGNEEKVGETEILSERPYGVGDDLDKPRRNLSLPWHQGLTWLVTRVDSTTTPPTLYCVEVIKA